MSTWNKVLKPVVVLCIITVIVTSALAVTNYLTAPIIAEAIRVAEEKARTDLLPDATGFTRVEAEFEGVSDVYNTDNNVGTVITAAAKGYSSTITLMVAFDVEGTIKQINITGQGETVGLGTKIVTEEGFQASFVGLEPVAIGNGEIDIITGATISSDAVIVAVNYAISAYNLASEAMGGTIATPEEIALTKIETTRTEMFPDATGFTLAEGTYEGVTEIYTTDNDIGVVITAVKVTSYGPITAMVAFNTDDTIKSMKIVANSENPSVGGKIQSEPSFSDSFAGLPAKTLALGDIDAITGATGSSTSAMEAVNYAIAAYNALD